MRSWPKRRSSCSSEGSALVAVSFLGLSTLFRSAAIPRQETYLRRPPSHTLDYKSEKCWNNRIQPQVRLAAVSPLAVQGLGVLDLFIFVLVVKFPFGTVRGFCICANCCNMWRKVL